MSVGEQTEYSFPSNAPSAKALILLDLQQNRLGSGPGEGNLQTPYNYVPPKARIFVVNLSALRERKMVKVAVSGKRGAAEALRSDTELRKTYNVATLREDAASGQDMNLYYEAIKPITYRMTWDNREYFIPPATTENMEEMVEGKDYFRVPDGLWDKYLGNYERTHSADPRDKAEELQRLSVMWTTMHNPTCELVDDGVMTKPFGENEFGFIRFIRVPDREAPMQVDKAMLTAAEIAEA
jgi:hypothetical protein